MDPQRPLTAFLSWLIEDPERLARYHTTRGFQELAEVWEHELSDELQTILNNNDLRSALDVIRRETGGDNVLFFVIMGPPPPPPHPKR